LEPSIPFVSLAQRAAAACTASRKKKKPLEAFTSPEMQ